MCVAIPGRIVSLEGGGMAVVDFGGSTRDISVSFLEEPAVGEFVIVHAGFALHRITEEEAEETRLLLEQVLDESGL